MIEWMLVRGYFMLTGNTAEYTLDYNGVTFALSDVDSISIDGEVRYPEDEDTITIEVFGDVITVLWSEVTDQAARDILLSYLAPV